MDSLTEARLTLYNALQELEMGLDVGLEGEHLENALGSAQNAIKNYADEKRVSVVMGAIRSAIMDLDRFTPTEAGMEMLGK